MSWQHWLANTGKVEPDSSGMGRGHLGGEEGEFLDGSREGEDRFQEKNW